MSFDAFALGGVGELEHRILNIEQGILNGLLPIELLALAMQLRR